MRLSKSLRGAVPVLGLRLAKNVTSCLILCSCFVHLTAVIGTAQGTRRGGRRQPSRREGLAKRVGKQPTAPTTPNADLPQLRVQVGHTLAINTLALSGDGTKLLSGSEDHSLILWDATSGTMLRQYSTYVSQPIKSVAFSPDGKKIIVMSELFVNVVDIVTGKEVYSYLLGNDFQGMPMSVAVSNDGRLLLVGDNFGQSAYIFSLATGKKVREYKQPGSSLFPLIWQSVAFSPDNKRFIIGGCPTTTVYGSGCKATVWDTDRVKPLQSFNIDAEKEQFLFTKDGSKVFMASSDRLLLNSADTGQTVSSFEGLIEDIGGRSLSEDGSRVWTIASDGRSASLSDVSSGKKLDEFSPGAGVVKSVFHQAGSSFALMTDDTGRDIFILDVELKHPKVEFHRYGYRVTAGAFSPDGSKVLLADSNHSAVLWDLLSGKPELRLLRHRDVINAVAFSADGSKIVTGSDDHSAILWDAATGGVLKVFDEPDSVAGVAFTKDGGRVVTVSVDPFFKSPKTSHVMSDAYQIQAIYQKAARGDLNISFTTWDASSFGKVKRWERPINALGEFAFPNFAISPDAETVALSEFNDTVTLYDVMTGDVNRRFKDGGAYADAISFSHDGQQVLVDNQAGDMNQLALSMLTGKADTNLFGQRVITLWNVKGDGKSTFRRDFMESDYRYAPGGNYIYSTVANNITQWEYPSFKVRHVLSGHNALVRSISTSASRGLVLTTSDDGTARIWTEAGVELCRLISLDRNWVVVRPDGRFDTGSFDDIKGLQWALPNAPNDPLPLEIFMRDYYEPSLLPRILKGDRLSAMTELRSIGELNRNQPKVGKITVEARAGNSELVDVNVQVSSVVGQCLKEGKQVGCESGVYDLRLYRDGQLIQQSPAVETSKMDFSGSNWREQLQEWRRSSVVKTKGGLPVTAATGRQDIVFTGIQLPRRGDVSQVEFTAYAFNEDRVKSATSEPSSYPLRQPRPGAKRRAYVITVGVDATSDPSIRLAFAPNGAREVEGLLKKRLGSEYEFVPVQLISEYKKGSDELQQDQATKSNIQTVLNLLSIRGGTAAQRQAFPMLQTATPDDLVVVYLASHGYADPNGRFYVIPSDIGEPEGVSEELLNGCLKKTEQVAKCSSARDFLSHTISSDELTQWLQAVDAGQMVLILDSCHSAAVSGPNFKPGPMGDAGFGQLSYDKGMLVLAATQAENVAWGTLESEDRSLLTNALTGQPAGGTQSFDFRQWLGTAEKRVPVLYQQNVKEDKLPQEPMLFDFTRSRIAIAKN